LGYKEIRIGTKFEETEMAVTKDSLIIRQYESKEADYVSFLVKVQEAVKENPVDIEIDFQQDLRA